jgi:hypothetical protein
MSVIVNEFEVVPELAAAPQPAPAQGGSDAGEAEHRLAELLRLRAMRVERLRAG